MEIRVAIERVAGNGYRARGGELFPFTAEGETREQALAKLQALIEERLKSGTEVVTLQVDGGQQSAWQAMAGMFKDDPLFDEWQKAIEEYRREVDEDPNAL